MCLTKCCCCGLRIGCYVIAGISIAIAVINIIFSGFILHLLDISRLDTITTDARINGSIISTETELNPQVYLHGITIALGVLLIIASILLIIGTGKRIKKLLLPWVSLTVLNCLMWIVSIIIVIVSMALEKGGSLKNIALYMADLLVAFYCIAVVMSLYKNDCYEIGESRTSRKKDDVHYDPVARNVYM